MILAINLKGISILEIIKKQTNKQTSSGKVTDLPKYSLLVFYCCVINYHKLSSLRQYKSIISKCLCIRSLGTSTLGLLLWRAVSCEAPGALPSSHGGLKNSVLFRTEDPIFLLTINQRSALAPRGLHWVLDTWPSYNYRSFFLQTQQKHLSPGAIIESHIM